MPRKIRFSLAAIVAGVRCVSGMHAGHAAARRPHGADTIYFGGSIVTVDAAQPAAEAVAVKDGRIVAVGKRAEVEGSFQGAATAKVDLAGKTLLPGFLDPHSHYFSSLSVANQVNVFAPPAGPGKDIPSIVEELRKFRDARALPKDELVLAYGYDDNVMPGGVGLTREDIDAVFPDNPVMVGHVSMHGAVLQLGGAREVRHHRRDADPAGRHHRAPAGLERAGRAAHGDGVHADRRVAAAARRAAGDRVDPRRAAALRRRRHHDRARGGHGQGVARGDAARRGRRRAHHRRRRLSVRLRLRRDPRGEPGRDLGQVREPAEAGRRARSPSMARRRGKTAFFTTPYLTGGPSGEKNWSGEPGFTQEALDAFVKKRLRPRFADQHPRQRRRRRRHDVAAPTSAPPPAT